MRIYPIAFTWVYKKTNDYNLSLEILHETYILWMEKVINNLIPDKSIGAYILGICKRQTFDHYRKPQFDRIPIDELDKNDFIDYKTAEDIIDIELRSTFKNTEDKKNRIIYSQSAINSKKAMSTNEIIALESNIQKKVEEIAKQEIELKPKTRKYLLESGPYLIQLIRKKDFKISHILNNELTRNYSTAL